MQQALTDRTAVYYVGDDRDGPVQRASLAREIARLLPGFAQVGYPGWEELMERFWRDAPEGIVLVLDEFPALVWSSPELPSLRWPAYLGHCWEQMVRESVGCYAYLGQQWETGTRWWGKGLSGANLELDVLVPSMTDGIDQYLNHPGRPATHSLLNAETIFEESAPIAVSRAGAHARGGLRRAPTERR